MENLNLPDISHVLAAGLSNNLEERRAAEAEINKLLAENMGMMLATLTNEAVITTRRPETRMMAGTVLRNAISASSTSERIRKNAAWLALNGELRTLIKNNLVKAMSDPTYALADSAAQSVAKIAVIELPENAWEELIPGLLTFIRKNAAEGLRVATLSCLGYICEEVPPEALAQKSDDILTAIVGGMQSQGGPQCMLAATKAFNASLSFIEGNFKVPQERVMIMSVIIQTAKTSNSAEVQVCAMECIVRIASLYYEFLGDFMGELFPLTMGAIKEGEEDMKLQAIEFWTTIASEEADIIEDELFRSEEGETIAKSENLEFTLKALSYIMPTILDCLVEEELDNVYDEDSWNVPMAAATCVENASLAVSSAIIPQVMPFVMKNINSPEWNLKEAAILAFGSILQGVETEDMAENMSGALQMLLQMLNGNAPVQIRDTAAWTIGRICAFHINVVLPHVHTVLEHVVPCLKMEHPVACNACYAIHNIAGGFTDPNNPGDIPATTPLSRYFTDLIEALVAAAYRSDTRGTKLQGDAFEAVNVIIDNGAEDTIPSLKQALPNFISMLEHTFSMQIVNAEDKEKQSNLQGYICVALRNITKKLKKGIEPHAKAMFQLYYRIFQNAGDQGAIHEDVLLAFGAAAAELQESFAPLAPEFMDFVCHALAMRSAPSVVVVAVGVIGDLCKALGKSFVQYSDTVVKILADDLRDADFPTKNKVYIISCFADIAQALGAAFGERYLGGVCQILDDYARNPPVDKDDDYAFDLLNEVWDALLEAYVGIIQGLADRPAGTPHPFTPYVEQLVLFIQHVWQEPSRKAIVTQGVVGVLGDVAANLGKPVTQQYLANQVIEGILIQGKNSPNEKIRMYAGWSMNVITKVMAS
eukprot:CAMPEP_0119121914 /NCGR_PEP_ID=MMETSP1310-20130426/2329_1 /TAXON_ID=464262 /ORGANISM="Genus nov. species nov., Strain RCC2339" /LENGTH=875 /DNA_ID=CAMNT_0007111509 /DNA_START=167 /DNA_END=2794 /DNA_ORIENTATION=+